MNGSNCDAQLQNSSSSSSLYPALLANIVFNFFLCYTTIMLNSVTIHALRKTSSLPKPLRSLLLSLAVSVLRVGLLGQPLHASYKAKEIHEQCNLPNHGILMVSSRVVLNILCITSFFNIMALSVDRFLVIQQPLQYDNIVTYKRAVVTVTSIWLFSTCIALCMTLLLPLNITLVILVIVYFFCFVATTWSSYKMYSTVRYHRMQIQAQAQQVAQNSEMVNIASLSKSFQSTFFIYFTFWVCYLPNLLILVARVRKQSTILSTPNEFALALVFLNSSLNPVIYCWKMRHIRHSVMGILRNIFRR